MKADAELICRLTPFGEVCEWKGGKVAIVSREALMYVGGEPAGRKIIKSGEVYRVGRLKLRSLGFAFNPGCYTDMMYVMLESPHAQLYWLYRENALRLVWCLSNVESRIWAAYRGFMLRKSPEGERLRLTGWVADRLL